MSFTSPRFWAHMEEIDEHWEPLTRTYQGEVQVLDTHHLKVKQVRCECGHEWTIPVKDWPGRRKLKSCGRPECPFTEHSKPKKPLEKLAGISRTVYLSEASLNWLLEQKASSGISVSSQIEAMVTKARIDKLVEV